MCYWSNFFNHIKQEWQQYWRWLYNIKLWESQEIKCAECIHREHIYSTDTKVICNEYIALQQWSYTEHILLSEFGKAHAMLLIIMNYIEYWNKLISIMH